MAMFLPESSAASAMGSVGPQASRLAQSTTMGPPRAPPTPMAIGSSGVSFMPSLTPPPTSVGATQNAVSRVDSRKQVLFQENPRVGLHYCVSLKTPAQPPNQYDLCFLDSSSATSWSHPVLYTIHDMYQRMVNEWRNTPSAKAPASILESKIEAVTEIFRTCKPVGVFNTDSMDAKMGPMGVHVALNAHRHTCITDHWQLDTRAGDRLWIVVAYPILEEKDVKGYFLPEGGIDGGKKIPAYDPKMSFVAARSKKHLIKIFNEKYSENYVHCTIICVGVVQNRLPAAPGLARIVDYDRMRNPDRQREVHLTLNRGLYDCI